MEGPPQVRRKLDKAPMSAEKAAKKGMKFALWLLIGIVTGATFAAYFADAFQLWKAFLTLSAPLPAWITLLFFILCSFTFAGFLREQVCFWLCPYARIQGVMYDSDTILPTYDLKRGEPRTRLHKGGQLEGEGDCVACNLCHAVCPTGIDIRNGQQEGCITCGLCIDACHEVMTRVNRPTGLIRYASLDEMEGRKLPPLFKRPRVIIYTTILALSLSGILYGLANLGGMAISVIHERQPLFVRMSDGSIQNKYTLKIVNPTDGDLHVKIEVDGPPGLDLSGLPEKVTVPVGKVKPVTLFLRIKERDINKPIMPVVFRVYNLENEEMKDRYESMFMGPKK